MTLGSFYKLWIFREYCILIYLLLIRCRCFFPYSVYERRPSVFIKICLIHISTGTTCSFIKRLTTVTTFTLCSECTQPNPAHHRMNLTPSKIFYDRGEKNSYLPVSRYKLLCLSWNIHTSTINWFYGGTLPLHCFCNQYDVYYSINSRSKNITQPLKSYTSDTFLMGWYL